MPCRYMLIGEGPGVEEDKGGRPFVGKAGRELWRYLWQACHLCREEVYTTNLVKYRVAGDGDPSALDIERDSKILQGEITNVNPEIIITLGRWATRRFLDGADMEWCHGVPFWSDDYNLAVFPCVHPAAGLHSTEFQGTIAWDFEQLGKLLRGEEVRWAAEDEITKTEYVEVDRHYQPIVGGLAAVDTEGSVAKPWCATWSQTPGLAACARRGQMNFQHVVLHNALHDIGVLRSLDAYYDSFDDTMIMAYLLCVEPQGLKALAKRHCGMEMNDYMDLVAVPNRELAVGYLAEVGKWLSRQSNSALPELLTTSSKSRKRTSGPGGRKSSRTALPAKSKQR